MSRFFAKACLISLASVGLSLTPGQALAQSTASTYSYGTYNPVQAAINRNSMNAAIIRQATRGKHGHGRGHTAVMRHAHKHR